MSKSPILRVTPLGFPWQCQDPFLFTVHHEDDYPAGNEHLGPKASLEGRARGQDFDPAEDWRMYHGRLVPGFPAHPHSGFETVTVVRKGLVDHSDSLGATGRFGNGDTQWMTAGAGVQHSEMFPLVSTGRGNPLELFQIWLNLPSRSKGVAPYYTMLWSEEVPRVAHVDATGGRTDVEVIAGPLEGAVPPPPPPDSWAADPDHALAIWVIRMDAGATWTLPASPPALNRTLFYYGGDSIEVAATAVAVNHSVSLASDQAVTLSNGGAESCLLLLQGLPIGEPVVSAGPFVMNTQTEIEQAYADFRRTQFGGWPWRTSDPVHPRLQGRFARYPDGKVVVK